MDPLFAKSGANLPKGRKRGEVSGNEEKRPKWSKMKKIAVDDAKVAQLRNAAARARRGEVSGMATLSALFADG
jgi:hypothetical protein